MGMCMGRSRMHRLARMKEAGLRHRKAELGLRRGRSRMHRLPRMKQAGRRRRRQEGTAAGWHAVSIKMNLSVASGLGRADAAAVSTAIALAWGMTPMVLAEASPST